MVSSLPLQPHELSVPVKENPDRKKIRSMRAALKTFYFCFQLLLNKMLLLMKIKNHEENETLKMKHNQEKEDCNYFRCIWQLKSFYYEPKYESHTF